MHEKTLSVTTGRPAWPAKDDADLLFSRRTLNCKTIIQKPRPARGPGPVDGIYMVLTISRPLPGKALDEHLEFALIAK